MNRSFSLIIIFILGLVNQSFAQGDLLITPTRVVFDGNKQKEPLSLVNMGKDTATYSISFVQRNMNEDGSFVTVVKPDSGQRFADQYLRIFPRKVTLAPGEPQVIMLQCRRTPDMEAGEFRSHLYFRSESNYKPLGMENAPPDSALLNVQLIPIFGISIPIIIRSGSVIVSSKLSDLKIDNQQDGTQNLRLTINRSGNISIFGNLIVEYVPQQGKSYQVGVLNGVGVYTNISKRNVSIKLETVPGITFTNGKLKVQYISSDENKRVVYAEAEVEIR
jgi:hypothetical protein